jgi:hypothetical protein
LKCVLCKYSITHFQENVKLFLNFFIYENYLFLSYSTSSTSNRPFCCLILSSFAWSNKCRQQNQDPTRNDYLYDLLKTTSYTQCHDMFSFLYPLYNLTKAVTAWSIHV